MRRKTTIYIRDIDDERLEAIRMAYGLKDEQTTIIQYAIQNCPLTKRCSPKKR